MNDAQQETAPQQEFIQDSLPPHIHLREDGCFEWACELNTSRSQHLMFTIMAMILIPSIMVFVGILFYTGSYGIPISNLLSVLRMLVAILRLVALIIVFSYLLTEKAVESPPVYTYEMNDYGIRLKPGGRNPIDMRQSADTSVFRTVRTIRIDRQHHMIALNSWFLYNLIYCNPEDFDFVVNYITKRCVRAIILKH